MCVLEEEREISKNEFRALTQARIVGQNSVSYAHTRGRGRSLSGDSRARKKHMVREWPAHMSVVAPNVIPFASADPMVRAKLPQR